ncbi:hypothetical protein HPB50_023334 [Hyalomma asiaticum]|uniref:Uncharacterized protein n=1 Tax=Hyalomma asiaticum TaxID=266040 RepID=A0ACB7TMY9_HYAAI|nr:hypothetical protein HPB50_023334 [Hyalomma asiaticum]
MPFLRIGARKRAPSIYEAGVQNRDRTTGRPAYLDQSDDEDMPRSLVAAAPLVRVRWPRRARISCAVVPSVARPINMDKEERRCASSPAETLPFVNAKKAAPQGVRNDETPPAPGPGGVGRRHLFSCGSPEAAFR